MTLSDTHSATSSPASAAGPMPSNSQGGQTMFAFGLEAAHANRFRAPASERAKWTSGICGPNSTASSRSAALQRSLANRLRQTTDLNGSMEYRLTWKSSTMPSQRRICRLAAKERHTKGKGFSGWPTPVAQPANGTPERFLERKRESVARTGKSMGICLSDLQMVAMHQLRGWATPRARDSNGNGVSIDRAAKGVADSLDLQCKLVCQSGTDQPSPSNAQTVPAAYPLNPAHSRWLQGYPPAWDACGVTAMQSCRKSRRSS